MLPPTNDSPATKVWVEITVENPEGNNSFIGQVDHPLETSIFAKSADDFIRLDRVRWREDLNDFEFRIVKQEEQKEDYADCLFIKKRKIIYICPIRGDSEIWTDAGERERQEDKERRRDSTPRDRRTCEEHPEEHPEEL